MLLAAPNALGHTGFHHKTIRVLIKPDKVYLSVQVALPGGIQSRRARQAWDTDGDRRIDRAEREAALAALYALHCDALALNVDGRVLQPRLRSSEGGGLIGPVDGEDAISVSFQLEVGLPKVSGQHALVIQDRPRAAGGHVPVTLQAGRGVVLASHDGLDQRPGARGQVVAVITADHPLLVTFRRMRAERAPPKQK